VQAIYANKNVIKRKKKRIGKKEKTKELYRA
jgi:hypothetical protein